jgi:hypothetical protein
LDNFYLTREKVMKKGITRAPILVAIFVLLWAGGSSGIVFMPDKDMGSFVDKLPSGLSEDVNQKVKEEAKTILVHHPLEKSPRGEDLALDATVRNKPPQAMVVIHYRHEAGKPFFTREMESATDSLFTYKLPGYLLSDDNLEYYLEVISATQIHAQSGTHFQPHRVELFSETGGGKYLLWGLLLVGGVFMLYKMGSNKKRPPKKKAKSEATGSMQSKLARNKLSAKVRR